MTERDQEVEEVELTVYDHGLTASGLSMKYTLDGSTRGRQTKTLPLSQIKDKTPHPKNEMIVSIRIPEWLARKEGLI